MKITDHKLSEGIALTFRVPEGNIKHPLIILCHGFCGIRVTRRSLLKVIYSGRGRK
nr:Hydrolase, alpha/beta fold family [Escherichia coli]